MKKRTITGKLNLEKLTIAKLSDTRTIVGGGIDNHSDQVLITQISYCGNCGQTLTAIGPTQTLNQGPTRRLTDICPGNNQ